MNGFRFREIEVHNYRCFDSLKLSLEEDLTVLFAENGHGKTALLTALAMGIAAFQSGTPSTVKLNARHDSRMLPTREQGRAEPVGPCTVAWTAAVGEMESVSWSAVARPSSGRTTIQRKPIFEAMDQIRVPGARWPLFAWYGVDRLARTRGSRRKVDRTGDRWEAYAFALDPSLDEAPLLQWLQDEMLGDVVRRRQEKPERFFDKAVMDATVRATPRVTNAWYDPVEQSPRVGFDDGHEATWSQLSDGYHVFIALVADIARRAVMLNEFDGVDAPTRVEGVVLIDEIDLHLHPRWQRVALPRLRKVFPRLQLVVTTHSPQVLSGVKNRQARRLFDGRLQEYPVLVEGRDTNAILREPMNTDDRSEEGSDALRELYGYIDEGNREGAVRLYQALLVRWGGLDPALIRAQAFIDLDE